MLACDVIVVWILHCVLCRDVRGDRLGLRSHIMPWNSGVEPVVLRHSSHGGASPRTRQRWAGRLAEPGDDSMLPSYEDVANEVGTLWDDPTPSQEDVSADEDEPHSDKDDGCKRLIASGEEDEGWSSEDGEIRGGQIAGQQPTKNQLRMTTNMARLGSLGGVGDGLMGMTGSKRDRCGKEPAEEESRNVRLRCMVSGDAAMHHNLSEWATREFRCQ